MPIKASLPTAPQTPLQLQGRPDCFGREAARSCHCRCEELSRRVLGTAMVPGGALPPAAGVTLQAGFGAQPPLLPKACFPVPCGPGTTFKLAFKNPHQKFEGICTSPSDHHDHCLTHDNNDILSVCSAQQPFRKDPCWSLSVQLSRSLLAFPRT